MYSIPQHMVHGLLSSDASLEGEFPPPHLVLRLQTSGATVKLRVVHGESGTGLESPSFECWTSVAWVLVVAARVLKLGGAGALLVGASLH